MTAVAPNRPPAVEPIPYRLSVNDYHRMIEAGIFGEDDRIELIEGELRAMPPIGPEHSGKNKRLIRLFTSRVKDRAIVSSQDPLTLPEHSEPEPDLMLLRPRADFYEGANPLPADTLLVIEIADSTLRYDRSVKIPLYAAHGVPETWLLDLQAHRIELYRDPGPAGYRQILLPDLEQTISPVLLPELSIRVAELWG